MGAMRQLERVILRLRCNPLEGPDTLHYSGEVLPDLLRDSLINAAIDSALALSIFQLIFPTASTPNSTAQRPRYLKLDNLGALNIQEMYPNPSYNYLSILGKWLARKWVVRSDRDGEIAAKELGKTSREPLEQHLNLEFDGLNGPDLLAAAWKEIWPLTEGRAWKNGWASLPLKV
jgi:hypothetical protein